MSAPTTPATDVFSAREIARAAGVRAVVVERLIRAGTIPTIDGRFMNLRHARAVVRHLRTTPRPEERESGPIRGGQISIFSDNRDLTPSGNTSGHGRRAAGRGLAASGAAHAAVLAVLAIVGAGGVQEARTPIAPAQLPRLVFVATPGLGGGGGGGGLRQPAPPPRARLEGRAVVRSPVPPPRRVADARPVERRTVPPPPVRPRPVERPVEPPPAPRVTEPLPQVVAPVATVAADAADRAGILSDSALETTSENTSSGSGTGGGAGSGAGSGIGEGEGSGIGPGSGGGTGGGPYRPGSGITPPAVVREVKPQYTQDARRRAIEGDVVVEIIVRADGSVGQVRLLQGLGAGLDQRAIDAVRQWRFSPARRHGTPVDVVVEVAVEFKLR